MSNTPKTNLLQLAFPFLFQGSPILQRSKRLPAEKKDFESMQNKAVFARTLARLLDSSPEDVEAFFRPTGLFDLPEFQADMPPDVAAWFESWDTLHARLIFTTILDAFRVSATALRKIIKKG